VLGEFGGDRLRERNVSGLAPFRQGEHEAAPDDLDLAHDVQGPAEELHVVDRGSEDPALPQSAAGGDGRGDPVARRQRFAKTQYLLGRPGRDLAGE
jgi:hypothetical protein